MTNQPEALRVADMLESAWRLNGLAYESYATRLLREQHAALEKKSDAIQRLWKERDQFRAVVELLLAAVLAEREACAQIVDANAAACANNSMLRDVLRGNAAAIRARGEKP